jgi:hypothetical protein
LIFSTGCKKNEATQQNSLAVTVSAGVTGNPVTGTYAYNDGDSVSYAYALEAGYVNLEVLLDGASAPAAGTIIMNGNHTLAVTADEQQIQNYTLTVTVGEGVDGAPAEGDYSYVDGDTTNYSYTLKTNYAGLKVTVDGQDVAAAGVINMNRDHELDAVTTSFDIRGDWDFVINWSDNSQDLREYTFVGSETEGDVRDGATKIGEYTVDGYDVQFTTSSGTYEFTGGFTDIDTMEGTWSGSPWSDDWTATRKN